jgi:hypothetical protein
MVITGGWPNEIGPKATRSNIGMILWIGVPAPPGSLGEDHKAQGHRDAETGDRCARERVATWPGRYLGQALFRSLVKIAFTVPKGIFVCFAILLAPNAFS